MVAEKFAAEGSNIAINYYSSEAQAKELAAKIEADHKVKAIVIQGVSERRLKYTSLCIHSTRQRTVINR